MNTASVLLIVSSSVFILLSLFLKNSNFLDVRFIISQHFKVFDSNRLQLVSIFIVPLFLAIGITMVKCVDRDILNNLNIVLSIIIAMYFSVLSILSAFSKENKSENYQKLLKETFNSTVFEAILCLLLLVVSFTILFIGYYSKSIALYIVSVIIYYLSIVITLNTLVVIKRIKVLFDN